MGSLQAKILLFSRRAAYLRTGCGNLAWKVAVRSRRCRETIFVCRPQLVRVAKSSTRVVSSGRRICAFESARPDGRLLRTRSPLEAALRSGELSAQTARAFVCRFRVFRFSLARTRVRCFLFFAFTASPTRCNDMIFNTFGVKAFYFFPSPSASHPLPPSIRAKGLLFSGIVFKNPEVPNRNGRW